MRKLSTVLPAAVLGAAIPLAAIAQTTASDVSTSHDQITLPQAGTREVTVGGSGGSNKNFNNSFGGAAVSYGQYLNLNTEIVLRQTVDYSNPAGHHAQWNGSTKIAVDQNFSTSQLRPFVGVNFGGLYGQTVRDTWAAGLEGGAKYYVKPQTFIGATVEYGWLFEHAHSIDDRFDKGAWTWSVGMGFDF